MLKKNVNISVMFKNCIICVIDLKASKHLVTIFDLNYVKSNMLS